MKIAIATTKNFSNYTIPIVVKSMITIHNSKNTNKE
jgi:hypothetical protein